MIEYRKVELKNINKSGYGGGGGREMGTMVHSHAKRSIQCLIVGYNQGEQGVYLLFIPI